MQFHIIKLKFILGDPVFAFKWLHEQIGMHKKFSQVFSAGPKNPVIQGTSLSNGILPQFFEVFINIHEYANEIIFI